MNFSDYLKHARELKGWSIWKLFQESDVSHVHIGRIEKGEMEPPKPETLRKLSQALNVDYIEMLKAAGALTDEDLLRIEIKNRFSPVINDAVALELMTDKNVLEVLEGLAKLDKQKRAMVLKNFLGTLGMLGE